MWFIRRKKQAAALAQKEAEIQAIRHETLEKLDTATQNTKQLNQALKTGGGVTELIFLATGGGRRK